MHVRLEQRAPTVGWGLGTADQILLVIGQEPFPCHKTIRVSGEDIESDHLTGCAGAAIYLNRVYARSRSKITAEHQDVVKDVDEYVLQSVFANPGEFISHHTRRKTPEIEATSAATYEETGVPSGVFTLMPTNTDYTEIRRLIQELDVALAHSDVSVYTEEVIDGDDGILIISFVGQNNEPIDQITTNLPRE